MDVSTTASDGDATKMNDSRGGIAEVKTSPTVSDTCNTDTPGLLVLPSDFPAVNDGDGMDVLFPSAKWTEGLGHTNMVDVDLLSELLEVNGETGDSISSSVNCSLTDSSSKGEIAKPVTKKKWLAPEERVQRRKLRHASDSQRQRIRRKMELENLKAEKLFLSRQLQALVDDQQRAATYGPCSQEWKELAATERHRRQLADRANEQLRRNLYVACAYAQNLKTVLSSTKQNRVDVNMCFFLHKPIHLPRDVQSRSRALEAVCTEAKLNLAARILQNETCSTRPFTTPSFSWKSLDVGATGFGVTSIAVFALETTNMCKAFKTAIHAITTCGVIWPNYSLMQASVNQFDVSGTKFRIRYMITENRFQSSTSNEQVLIESRDVSYHHVGESASVFIWDYVDDDELHPISKTTTVKRTTVGALLVRIERCDDGIERVVCRYICSKAHFINSTELPPDIQRFSRSSEVGAKVADSLVFETIKGGVCADGQ